MAYQNISFPTMKLVHGFSIETDYPVSVVSNFAKEYRISRYTNAKNYFRFQARNLTAADWSTIASFISTVNGTKDSFNFTVPGTSTTVKVRLDKVPDVQYVALNSDGTPKIVAISEIKLIQVFNE